MGEGLPGQLEAERLRGAARRVERGQHRRVVCRVDHDEHVVEVLRGRADHARTADVDLLDEIVERHVGLGRRLDKGIQVHDDHVDEADAVAFGGVEVVAAVAPGEDAPVDERVQRLDPAVHHLGEPGDVGDVGHRQPGLGQGAGGAAGRHQFQAAAAKSGGQVDQAGLVGNTQKSSGHWGDP